jgi:hypothetical protein
MFSKELKHWSGGHDDRQGVLRGAVQSLDQGKRYVMEGYGWICAELFDGSRR